MTENQTKTSQRLLFSKAYSLQDYHTIYQAELTAITKAAEHLSRQAPLPDKRCSSSLNKLGSNTQVLICWIKAHVGHTGNKKADKMAKIGASKTGENLSTLDDISAPYSYGPTSPEKLRKDFSTSGPRGGMIKPIPTAPQGIARRRSSSPNRTRTSPTSSSGKIDPLSSGSPSSSQDTSS